MMRLSLITHGSAAVGAMNGSFSRFVFPLHAYFQRIGLPMPLVEARLHSLSTPPPQTSPTCAQHHVNDITLLSHMMAAHASSIPFETMDPILGRRVSLQLEDLCNKLIHARRGGYCFEHNTLFLGALTELGFTDIRCLAGRVIWESLDSALGRTHMMLLVPCTTHISDASSPVLKRWLVDVGFGSGIPLAPLDLDCREPQVTPAGVLRVVESEVAEGWTEYRVECLNKRSHASAFSSSASSSPLPLPPGRKSGAAMSGETVVPTEEGSSAEEEKSSATSLWRPLYHFDLQPQHARDYWMANYVMDHASFFTYSLQAAKVVGNFESFAEEASLPSSTRSEVAGGGAKYRFRSSEVKTVNDNCVTTRTRLFDADMAKDGKSGVVAGTARFHTTTTPLATPDELYDWMQEHLGIDFQQTVYPAYTVTREQFEKAAREKLVPFGGLGPASVKD